MGDSEDERHEEISDGYRASGNEKGDKEISKLQVFAATGAPKLRD